MVLGYRYRDNTSISISETLHEYVLRPIVLHVLVLLEAQSWTHLQSAFEAAGIQCPSTRGTCGRADDH